MILNHTSALKEFVEEAGNSNNPIAVDTETDGTEIAKGSRICGFGLGFRSTKGVQTCYVPIRHEVFNKKKNLFGQREFVPNLDPNEVFSIVKPLLEDKTITKLAHNAKFEIQGFKVEGIECQNIHCTMIMAYLINPEEPNGLKHLLSKLFNEDISPLHRVRLWFKANGLKSEDIKSFGYKFVPLEIISPYTEKLDCEGCIKLFEYLTPQIKEHRKIYKIEHRLVPVIADLELEGVPINTDKIRSMLSEVDTYLIKVKKEIFSIAGREFTLSPAEISIVLYKELGLDVPRVRGAGLTDAGTLKKIDHPLARALLSYRSLETIRGTFLEPLLGYEYKGKIHCDFRQVKSWENKEDVSDSEESGGATSGRLACVSSDTIIETTMGSFKISDLPDPKILNISVITHTGKTQKVIHVFPKGMEPMFKIRTRNGNEITCTGSHRILTPTGWKSVSDIRFGDAVISNSK